ncbi:hypothetical protein M422DRAFT_34357 [Sphaerobolus stellatus SS14]|uniref:Uncharacterized protein n=1 Tax=Sphaerobolus stellatus (strain SS14) TaxID=990650 RepID=A0A0C9VF23_SPHS4|nr:hypothetical protein M422DRAFT_34357 [Sphaerobolus stellatus SS14]
MQQGGLEDASATSYTSREDSSSSPIEILEEGSLEELSDISPPYVYLPTRPSTAESPQPQVMTNSSPSLSLSSVAETFRSLNCDRDDIHMAIEIEDWEMDVQIVSSPPRGCRRC